VGVHTENQWSTVHVLLSLSVVFRFISFGHFALGAAQRDKGCRDTGSGALEIRKYSTRVLFKPSVLLTYPKVIFGIRPNGSIGRT